MNRKHFLSIASCGNKDTRLKWSMAWYFTFKKNLPNVSKMNYMPGTASLIEDIDSKLTAKELKYFSEFTRWVTVGVV